MKYIWREPFTFNHWSSRVIASVILLFVGYLSDQRFVLVDLGRDVFLRLALLLIILILSIRLTNSVKFDEGGGHHTSWWDISETSDKPTWEDVRRMTIGSQEYDPLTYAPVRRSTVRVIFKLTLYYLCIFCFVIEAWSIIGQGGILSLAFGGRPEPLSGLSTLKLDTNLTAFLAILAAVISIYFTQVQLQAKVKADSRQAWIDKLRKRIAEFIALADESHYHTLDDSSKINLTRSRIEMELLLNPSEKDHRLLMYLSMKLTFFDLGNKEFIKIEDINLLAKDIETSPDYQCDSWFSILKPIPAKNAAKAGREQAYSDLIGYVIRLAHIVLKREWERVKATR